MNASVHNVQANKIYIIFPENDSGRLYRLLTLITEAVVDGAEVKALFISDGTLMLRQNWKPFSRSDQAMAKAPPLIGRHLRVWPRVFLSLPGLRALKRRITNKILLHAGLPAYSELLERFTAAGGRIFAAISISENQFQDQVDWVDLSVTQISISEFFRHAAADDAQVIFA